jgi:hypothetical protein
MRGVQEGLGWGWISVGVRRERERDSAWGDQHSPVSVHVYR